MVHIIAGFHCSASQRMPALIGKVIITAVAIGLAWLLIRLALKRGHIVVKVLLTVVSLAVALIVWLIMHLYFIPWGC